MKAHPLSEVFPLMDADELRTLAEDIKAHGLKEPIIVYEGMILDGRNRWAACKLAKVRRVETARYEGDNPLAYVISANIHRRHLSVSQRAMIGAELAKLGKGRPDSQTPVINAQECAFNGTTQEEAAAALNVGKRVVQKAKKVLEKGSKKQIDKVKKGEATVSDVEAEIAEKERQEAQQDDPLAAAAADYCTVINQHTRRLDGLLAEFEALKEDPLGHDIHWPTVGAQLTAVRKGLHQGRPKRKCPYCSATGKKSGGACKPCRGTGYVCESIYRSGCAAVGVPIEKEDDG